MNNPRQTDSPDFGNEPHEMRQDHGYVNDPYMSRAAQCRGHGPDPMLIDPQLFDHAVPLQIDPPGTESMAWEPTIIAEPRKHGESSHVGYLPSNCANTAISTIAAAVTSTTSADRQVPADHRAMDLASVRLNETVTDAPAQVRSEDGRNRPFVSSADHARDDGPAVNELSDHGAVEDDQHPRLTHTFVHENMPGDADATTWPGSTAKSMGPIQVTGWDHYDPHEPVDGHDTAKRVRKTAPTATSGASRASRPGVWVCVHSHDHDESQHLGQRLSLHILTNSDSDGLLQHLREWTADYLETSGMNVGLHQYKKTLDRIKDSDAIAKKMQETLPEEFQDHCSVKGMRYHTMRDKLRRLADHPYPNHSLKLLGQTGEQGLSLLRGGAGSFEGTIFEGLGFDRCRRVEEDEDVDTLVAHGTTIYPLAEWRALQSSAPHEDGVPKGNRTDSHGSRYSRLMDDTPPAAKRAKKVASEESHNDDQQHATHNTRLVWGLWPVTEWEEGRKALTTFHLYGTLINAKPGTVETVASRAHETLDTWLQTALYGFRSTKRGDANAFTGWVDNGHGPSTSFKATCKLPRGLNLTDATKSTLANRMLEACEAIDGVEHGSHSYFTPALRSMVNSAKGGDTFTCLWAAANEANAYFGPEAHYENPVMTSTGCYKDTETAAAANSTDDTAAIPGVHRWKEKANPLFPFDFCNDQREIPLFVRQDGRKAKQPGSA